MAKKTKRPRAQQVSTNFKQNTRARKRNTGGGAGGRPSGRTQPDFDPDQNVKQVAEPEMPTAPAAAPTGDRFADAGLGAAPASPFPDEMV